MALRIQTFTFNDFGVNTYVVSDTAGNCILIDVACYSSAEEKMLEQYISKQQLTPVFQISTHAHVDHLLGVSFVKNQWNIPWLFHADGNELLRQAPTYASMFGFTLQALPTPDQMINDDQVITAGDIVIRILSTPGHAPGSVCLQIENCVFSGDVLFHNSIGRSDLPGGNHEVLITSIREKLLTLPAETIIYPGHGPTTSIDEEKMHNPFLIN